jgi:hypothetical protein
MIEQREPCADGKVGATTDASSSHTSSAAEARQAQLQSHPPASSATTNSSRPPALQIPKNRSSASLSSRFPVDGGSTAENYESLSRCVQNPYRYSARKHRRAVSIDSLGAFIRSWAPTGVPDRNTCLDAESCVVDTLKRSDGHGSWTAQSASASSSLLYREEPPTDSSSATSIDLLSCLR